MQHTSGIQHLTILGSTGSIGVSTLDVVARHPQRFRVLALTAHSRIDKLFEQCKQFVPSFAVVVNADAARMFEQRIIEAGLKTRVLCGVDALEQVASLPQVDTVMAAIVGIAGLRPTLAAAANGKKILLANKESLVTAGGVFMDTVRRHGATLLPIDSEHNAVFQSLPGNYNGNLDRSGVRRILLTASGGPFRTLPLDEFACITPEQACAHPNWVMGRKISVDSATMMNKGLEVIEAHWLFGAPAERIEVVVHPESIVHSMVEYVDGSVIAQLGNPDMRTPIAHALAYPERISNGVSFLDLAATGVLRFEKPDWGRFPCLALAFETLRAGNGAATVLNAANEVAVARFLDQGLAYDDIPRLIEAVLSAVHAPLAGNLDDVLSLDHEARERAWEWCGRTSHWSHPGTLVLAARS
ncbi:MAG TPA: 1-deoxy-D-xylulose-5-phosphate reductoisomerase [Burkholderiales bacterium]|nr:1-deoxy-D-xylulose-5-phosphate reductoisomerase [Burkholderiales bacterium]